MSATNQFETETMRHIFLNEAITFMGDTSGLLPSSSDGNIYIAAFTDNPGETGSVSNEATFTGYARVAVPRTGAYWSESNGIVKNIQNINFPECTGGTETITHYAAMKEATGDKMLFYFTADNPAPMSVGTILQFSPNQIVFELD